MNNLILTTANKKIIKKYNLRIPKEIKKKALIKNKIKGIINNAGRNNSGKITIYHKGKGHKRRYRFIDFNRNIKSIGMVFNIEYDPNRNSKIAAIFDSNNKHFFYIISPKNLAIGDIVESGLNIEPKLGNSLPIANIPVGCYIYNVSPKESKPAQIARSAGTFCKLKEKTLKYAIIELNSGEHRFISPNCFASIGIVSNEFNFLKKKYKAGQSRWLNIRPTVRGVAMNPIDHPHGGGEGKTSGLNKTPWGKYNNRGSTSKSRNKNIIKKYE
jgi:large subunit ribosomal protein L2